MSMCEQWGDRLRELAKKKEKKTADSHVDG